MQTFFVTSGEPREDKTFISYMIIITTLTPIKSLAPNLFHLHQRKLFDSAKTITYDADIH